VQPRALRPKSHFSFSCKRKKKERKKEKKIRRRRKEKRKERRGRRKRSREKVRSWRESQKKNTHDQGVGDCISNGLERALERDR